MYCLILYNCRNRAYLQNPFSKKVSGTCFVQNLCFVTVNFEVCQLPAGGVKRKQKS